MMKQSNTHGLRESAKKQNLFKKIPAAILKWRRSIRDSGLVRISGSSIETWSRGAVAAFDYLRKTNYSLNSAIVHCSDTFKRETAFSLIIFIFEKNQTKLLNKTKTNPESNAFRHFNLIQVSNGEVRRWVNNAPFF